MSILPCISLCKCFPCPSLPFSAIARGQDPLYKGGNRLRGSCGDFKMVPQQNAINANASLALPFFGYCPVRTPCIWEETACREAAVISKWYHNKMQSMQMLPLPFPFSAIARSGPPAYGRKPLAGKLR